MEEDALLQARELGKEFDVCELCGRPVPAGLLGSAERPPTESPTDTVRVCPRCKQELASGALPLDAVPGEAEDGSE